MIFSQSRELATLYNPARTGETDFVRIRGGARLQWIGIDNAPKSFAGTADMPFKLFEKRIGVGVVYSQESIGLFSNMLTSAQGSYKLKFLKGTLSLGLQVGYYNSRFRGQMYIYRMMTTFISRKIPRFRNKTSQAMLSISRSEPATIIPSSISGSLPFTFLLRRYRLKPKGTRPHLPNAMRQSSQEPYILTSAAIFP